MGSEQGCNLSTDQEESQDWIPKLLSAHQVSNGSGSLSFWIGRGLVLPPWAWLMEGPVRNSAQTCEWMPFSLPQDFILSGYLWMDCVLPKHTILKN